MIAKKRLFQVYSWEWWYGALEEVEAVHVFKALDKHNANMGDRRWSLPTHSQLMLLSAQTSDHPNNCYWGTHDLNGDLIAFEPSSGTVYPYQSMLCSAKHILRPIRSIEKSVTESKESGTPKVKLVFH
jgi:hypothetical protein